MHFISASFRHFLSLDFICIFLLHLHFISALHLNSCFFFNPTLFLLYFLHFFFLFFLHFFSFFSSFFSCIFFHFFLFLCAIFLLFFPPFSTFFFLHSPLFLRVPLYLVALYFCFSFQFNSCLSVALYPCFIYLRFTSASSHFFLLFFFLSFFALLPFRFSFCFPRPHFSFRSLHVPLPLFHSDSIIPTPPPSPFTPIPPHHLHPTQPRTKPAGGAQRHRLCPRCSAGDAHQAAAPLRSALRSSSALLPPRIAPGGVEPLPAPPGYK